MERKQAVTCDKCSNGSSSAAPFGGSVNASGNCNIYIYYRGCFSVKKKCVTGGFFHVPLACGFGERGGYFKDMSAILKQSQKPG